MGEDWLKPVEGYLTSMFGERINPITEREEFHNGLDIACEEGTPVKAIADGTVLKTGVSATFGNYLEYEVDGGYKIFYAHLSDVLINGGQSFKKGAVLARAGSTGLSTGAHLHLTVYEADKEVDPLLFFEYAP